MGHTALWLGAGVLAFAAGAVHLESAVFVDGMDHASPGERRLQARHAGTQWYALPIVRSVSKTYSRATSMVTG